jgi:Arc/MetJ-type ribon-helix-helix transcriptional regulator
MNIRLTPEQEAIVNAELESGNFRTAEEVIAVALQVLREKEHAPVSGATNGEQRHAVAEMLRFVEANRVKLDGVSVKELIHEGHHL